MQIFAPTLFSFYMHLFNTKTLVTETSERSVKNAIENNSSHLLES